MVSAEDQVPGKGYPMRRIFRGVKLNTEISRCWWTVAYINHVKRIVTVTYYITPAVPN